VRGQASLPGIARILDSRWTADQFESTQDNADRRLKY
jgi:hypothetical protein